jgi:hypothetical protein
MRCPSKLNLSGVVEFISPATLQSVGRIHFSIAPQSGGLNGVFAGAERSMLYIEGPGPIGDSLNPKGCFSLYTVDLMTLQARMVASVWGSRSRDAVSHFRRARVSRSGADSSRVDQRYELRPVTSLSRP